MALTDNTEILTLSTALGAADANLLTTLATGGSAAAQKINDVRDQIHSQLGDSDYDYATTWESSVRTVEKNLPTKVKVLLNDAVTAMDTYFVAVTGDKLRAYFHALSAGRTVAWTDAFRTLWARVKTEELVISLGYVAKTASGGTAWTSYSADKTVTVPTPMELRTGTSAAIGASAITVNITLRKESTSDPELIVKTIPALTAAGTQFSINGVTNTKFSVVDSLTVSGGSSADRVELWVAQ